MERLHQAQAELAERDADPFREKVEAAVRGMEAISTAAILDLLFLPKTTGGGNFVKASRRIASRCPRWAVTATAVLSRIESGEPPSSCLVFPLPRVRPKAHFAPQRLGLSPFVRQ